MMFGLWDWCTELIRFTWSNEDTLRLLFAFTRLAILMSLLVGVLALFSARAEAACGDYVHISSNDDDSAFPELSSKEPCSGQNCSQSPLAPNMPAPVPAPVPVPDIKALANSDCELCDSQRRRLTPRETVGRTIHRPRSVFHPPATERQ